MTTSIVGIRRGTPMSRIFAGDVAQTQYRTEYIIESDAPSTDDSKIVLETTGLPQLGDTWTGTASTDSTASVVEMSAAQDPFRNSMWIVDVQWDSEVDIGQGGQGGGGGGGTSPTDLSPEIEYDYEVVETERGFDAEGKTIATSAGEPFPDKIVFQRPITVLTYSRWETSHPAVVQQTYMNKCNSSPFSGADTYTVLMSGIRARLRPIIGTRLWWVTYTMKWDPEDWHLRKQDIGSFYGSLVSPFFKYVDGRLAEVHMDGAGNEVGGGHSAAILKFKPYGQVDFNTLNF